MMPPGARGATNGAAELTLAIDASTLEGSVAVIRGGVVLAERTVAMRGADEERLMPAVADAIADSGASTRELARIICGAGPGSFTSLRIAASIAKGLATATGARLFSVSSLELAAVEALTGKTGRREDGKTGHRPARVIVAIDAMRGDVFVGAYEWGGAGLVRIQASGIRRREQLDEIGTSLGADVVEGRPQARAVANLMESVVAAGPVDLATWEPDYGRKAEAQVRWEAAHGKPLAP